MYSPAFPINGHALKLYVYPRGNNNRNQQLSVYLDSGITDAQTTHHCTFKLALLNYKTHAERGGGAPASSASDEGAAGEASAQADRQTQAP